MCCIDRLNPQSAIVFSQSLLSRVLVFLSRWQKRLTVLTHVISMLQHMQQIDGRRKAYLSLLSLLVWLTACGIWVPLVHYMAGLDFPRAMIAIIVATSFTFLPVNPPAGIGLVEGGWVAGLLLFGIPVGHGVEIGLLVHALQIAATGVLTVMAWIWEKPRRKTVAECGDQD